MRRFPWFVILFVMIAAAAFALPYLFDGGMFAPVVPSMMALAAFLALVQVFFLERERTANPMARLMFLAVLGGLASLFRLLPLPMGANAFFFLPLLVAHVMGPTFGTASAALAMLMSGFLGGGLGPWLPYQVLASGVLGLLAGWTQGRGKAALLAVAFIGGILYGILMNLWFYPSLDEVEGGYWAFYVTTSLAWDLARAVAQVALVWAFYPSIARVLSRYRDRWVAGASSLPI